MWSAQRLCPCADPRAILCRTVLWTARAHYPRGTSRVRMNSFRRPVLSSAISYHCVSSAAPACGSSAHTSATLRAEKKRRLESLLKQCVFIVETQKEKLHFRNLLCGRDCNSPGLALSSVMMVWLQTRMELVCTVLIYHSVKKSHEHMLWCSKQTRAQMVLWAPSPRQTICDQMTMIMTPDENNFMHYVL